MCKLTQRCISCYAEQIEKLNFGTKIHSKREKISHWIRSVGRFVLLLLLPEMGYWMLFVCAAFMNLWRDLFYVQQNYIMISMLTAKRDKVNIKQHFVEREREREKGTKTVETERVKATCKRLFCKFTDSSLSMLFLSLSKRSKLIYKTKEESEISKNNLLHTLNREPPFFGLSLCVCVCASWKFPFETEH